jgi:hypothetical protein
VARQEINMLKEKKTVVIQGIIVSQGFSVNGEGGATIIYTYPPIYNLFLSSTFFSFMVVLGFELRASHLLGRSTT